MTFTRKMTSILLALLAAASMSSATNFFQLQGIAPYSTQTGGPFDSVDLANNNVVISIPIRTKTGKIPMSYTFQYSGAIGQTFVLGSGYYFTPPAGFSSVMGNDLGSKVAWSTNNSSYYCNSHQATEFSGFYVSDPTGAVHPLPASWKLDTANPHCDQTNYSGYVTDGTGYYANVSINGSNQVQFSLYNRSGDTLAVNYPYYTTATLTDPDGVFVSSSFSSGTTTYTDTLDDSNHHFLATTFPAQYKFTGSGSIVYKDANGGSEQFTILYTEYTERSNFVPNHCSSSVDYQLGGYFPTEIDVPGGGKYLIEYESTPGLSGQGYWGPYKTGRISKITYPSGGYVTYAYEQGSDNNGVYGIDCTTNAVPKLVRTVYDNNGNTSPWTYDNGGSSLTGNFNTTVTAPDSHQSYYYFAYEYETAHYDYSGTVGSTLLSAVVTCYNGHNSNANNCINPGSLPTVPFFQIDKFVYTYNSSGGSAYIGGKTTKLDTNTGMPTEVDNYDWSGTFPPSTVLSKTVNAYGTWNGSSCASVGNDITDHPCTVTVTGPSGQASQVKYTYNSGGHPTQISRWVTGSNTYLNSTASFNSNGTPQWIKDPAGNKTSFAYTGGCKNLLVTSATYAVTTVGTSYQTWDCNGGVVASTTDVNSNPTTYTYNDPLYRLTSITYPDSSNDIKSISYSTGATTPWSITTSRAVSNNGGSVSTEQQLDGLGRPYHTITVDPNSSTGHSYTDTVYNNLGEVSSVSNRYFKNTESTYGVTSYLYDQVGRPTSITRPDQTVVSYTYSQRASEVTGVQGLNRVVQVDGMGRTRYVCDGIGATTQADGANPTACGLDISASGFLATYGPPVERVCQMVQHADRADDVEAAIGGGEPENVGLRIVDVRETQLLCFSLGIAEAAQAQVDREHPNSPKSLGDVQRITARAASRDEHLRCAVVGHRSARRERQDARQLGIERLRRSAHLQFHPARVRILFVLVAHRLGDAALHRGQGSDAGAQPLLFERFAHLLTQHLDYGAGFARGKQSVRIANQMERAIGGDREQQERRHRRIGVQ